MSDPTRLPSCCDDCSAPAGRLDLPESPVGTNNIPGRTRLRYRVGVHGTFKESMLDAAARSEGLRAHTARGDESAAVALLDTCAVMLDVVTFYAEVQANEGYLPTAVERRSVLELARSIGYELKPGVAASTTLAFEVQTAPGLPDTVEVPAGTQVQSLPVGQELPQTFETLAPVVARPGWNKFTPKLTRPQIWEAGKTVVTLRGTGLGLRVSSRLVLQFAPLGGTYQVATIANLAEDYDRKVTLVSLAQPLAAAPGPLPAGFPKVVAFAAKAAVFGAAAPDWKSLPAASKREILGLDEDADIPPGERLEWPGFNIHLPGSFASRFTSPDAVAVLRSAPPSTAESIAQRVRDDVARYVDTVDAAFRTQVSTAGFSAAGTGVRGLDLVGGSLRTTAQALQAILGTVAGEVAAGPIAAATQLAGVLETLGQGLQQLLTLRVDLTNQVDTSLLRFVQGIRGLVDSLRGMTVSAGRITAFNPSSTGNPSSFVTQARDLLLAFQRGHPIALLNRVAGEIQRLLTSTDLSARARATADAFLASLGEFRQLALGTLRIGLARQAQAIVDTALQTALATPKPAQFRTRRGFLTFVAASLSKVVAYPATFGPGANLVAGIGDFLSRTPDPETVDRHLDPDLYEDFDPDAFASDDGLAVSDAEIALAAFAIGGDPRIALSFAALAGLMQTENLAQNLSDSGLLPVSLPGDGTTASSAVQQTSLELQNTILQALRAPAPVERVATLPANAVQDFTLYGTRTNTLSLDQEYPDVLPGSLAYLDDPVGTALLPVAGVETVSRSSFALSGKSTVLQADATTLAPFREAVRTLAVLAGSRELPLAEELDPTPLQGDAFLVPDSIPELAPGHRLALESLDPATGAPVAELLEIHAVAPVPEQAARRIVLAQPLSLAHARASVVLRANLADATHGAARSRILGHGDARLRFPAFALPQSPLTHVSSPTAPGGADSTLLVRVDGVAWERVDSFYGRGSKDEVYTLRLEDDGTSVVRFGDGRTGSRLPTGLNNVTATFRVGLGTPGNLPAGRLSNLASRPLGLTGVAQPFPGTGGEDPEHLDDARINAPLAVRTLDRLVSLSDYADYARAFAGIAKARSAWAWFGQDQGILLTVAGPDGAPVGPNDATFINLLASIERHRDRGVPFQVVSYLARPFAIAARLRIDERVETEPILAAARARLLDALSFARRELGQAVTSSDIVALLHALPEIQGVDLDAFHFVGAAPTVEARLVARAGSVLPSGQILPAELLAVDPDALSLETLGAPS